MTTRPNPQPIPLTDPDEALGRINPADAEALYRACEAAWGRNVFLVATDGRVLVKSGMTPISGGEARELGVVIGKFLNVGERPGIFVAYTIEDDKYFATLVYEDRSLPVPGRFFARDEAHSYASWYADTKRATVAGEGKEMVAA